MRYRTLEVTAPVLERLETADDPFAIAGRLCALADEFPGEAVSFTLTTRYENETPPLVHEASAAAGGAPPHPPYDSDPQG